MSLLTDGSGEVKREVVRRCISIESDQPVTLLDAEMVFFFFFC